MPELPEVETVVRSITPYVLGRTIRHVELFSRRVTRGDFAATIAGVTGALIQGVRRHGKQIFFELDRGILFIHLGMTGKLLINAAPSKYARAIFHLDEGALFYDDVRQFGRVEFFTQMPSSLARVGPDALTIGFAEFFERLHRRGGHIKPLLLNQSFVGGVGNIYADEALFAARIHPRAAASRLSEKRVKELHGSLIKILQLAIHHRGSSISDYVDADGAPGSFQQQHNVYGRAGQPCPCCGSPIRRIVLGQRGTHYCPRCQRP
ncbi:MAG TPA: bifunctional DNA-formamidopyrimidine glycosylase/DNA-(apurinic or apyrimidinic site) lyase [Bryobacteraceae bacterium]|nr:bifunctional DNA-formamidopyrimidine glycosylase/DNA-(apurinic or apyrimidinic site) lyase [Bryobacteraceae bacterium]